MNLTGESRVPAWSLFALRLGVAGIFVIPALALIVIGTARR